MSEHGNDSPFNFTDLQFKNAEDDHLPTFEEAAAEEFFDFDRELDGAEIIENILNTNDEATTSAPENTHPPDSLNQFELDICEHTECNKLNLKELAVGFRQVNMNERINMVRGMLFCTTSEPGQNVLMKQSTISSRKRTRTDSEPPQEHDIVQQSIDASSDRCKTTTAYSLKGKRVCVKSFCAVVNLSRITVQRHALEILKSDTLRLYKSRLGESRRGKWGIQRIVVKSFLISFASDHGLECPRGRGSQDESPIIILPSNFTKRMVHEKYKSKWIVLKNAVLEMVKNREEVN